MPDAPKLLVVEDNDQLTTILKMAFEYQGFQVSEASNGQEALEACHERGEHFDLILMDLQMPVMDGMTAARRLRAHPSTASTVIICLSANLDTVESQEELPLLFDATFRKPMSPRELVKRASSLLVERGVKLPAVRPLS